VTVIVPVPALFTSVTRHAVGVEPYSPGFS
jgi:hypothetical protein